MKRQYLLFLFLLLSAGLYAQERYAKGYVLDKDSRAALEGVEVRVEGGKEKAITNNRGEFIIDVPKGNRYLIVSMKNYQNFRYKLQPGFQHKPSRVYLESIYSVNNKEKSKQKNDSLFITYKNALSLSILEFLQVGLGIRYERFIVPKHAIGLHATYYFYGISSTVYTDLIGGYELNVKYKGFKIAPYYRFYLLRKKTRGLFLDAKIPFGYFNFNELEYRYSYYYSSHRYKHIDHSFWTWGGGISLGFMSRLPNRNRGFFNISVGYQYLPMVEPPEALYEETNSGHVFKYETDVGWWDGTGPGAKFEVKLTIGGLF